MLGEAERGLVLRRGRFIIRRLLLELGLLGFGLDPRNEVLHGRHLGGGVLALLQHLRGTSERQKGNLDK